MSDVVRLFPCPRCKKSITYDMKSPFRPFCSQGCKDDDIISWADGKYSMPGPPAEPEEIIDALRKQNRDDED